MQQVVISWCACVQQPPFQQPTWTCGGECAPSFFLVPFSHTCTTSLYVLCISFSSPCLRLSSPAPSFSLLVQTLYIHTLELSSQKAQETGSQNHCAAYRLHHDYDHSLLNSHRPPRHTPAEDPEPGCCRHGPAGSNLQRKALYPVCAKHSQCSKSRPHSLATSSTGARRGWICAVSDRFVLDIVLFFHSPSLDCP